MNERFQTLLNDSLLALDGPSGDVAAILRWVEERKSRVSATITRVPFSRLRDWRFDNRTGNLGHSSGKYFSIEGLDVAVTGESIQRWRQPIINQPEVGFLGIISKEVDGVLCFLLQAKIEPGNVNIVQLSPTLQATRSNYSMVHQGVQPKYFSFFQQVQKSQLVLDQVQSEQGARFFRKRNRNIILFTVDEVELDDDFIWVTLGQIKRLMRSSNIINMDTRTVIAGIQLSSDDVLRMNGALFARTVSDLGRDWFLSEFAHTGKNSLEDIVFWLSRLKSYYDLQVSRVELNKVSDWYISDVEISHKNNLYFSVFGVEVVIDNREVKVWGQPIVQPRQQGICAFLVKKIDGILHFLVQAKVECGNFDVVEIAPTVQCLTGSYNVDSNNAPPFLADVLQMNDKRVLFDTLQSEEGGRFYHEVNRNVILEVGSWFPEDSLPDRYAWMTLGQLKSLIKYNNFLNIQTRSLIAAVEYT